MTLLRMSDYGVKIVKAGKSIASDNSEDYIFWSKFPTLNIKQRGTIKVTTSGDEYPAPVTASITHGFGYRPQFMAFTTSYTSQHISKYIYELADYVNLDFYAEFTDVGENIVEEVMAYTTKEDFVVSAKLFGAISGFQQGIEYEYSIDYILFMEEGVSIS